MRNVGIFLFNDVEVLDFAGPFEVFSVTSELNQYQLFKVFTVAQNHDPITTVNRLKVVPEYAFSDHPPIDILILPGGVGTKQEMVNERTLSWIKAVNEKTEITFSVCSGARLLAKMSLLDDMEMTTHHEVMPDIRAISSKIIINENMRFIDNGKIMTSGGISAGIDLSLYVVEKLYGADVKNKTAQYMEYGQWK